MRDQHRRAEAVAVLQPVYDQFTEGFGTADLRTAKELIDTRQLFNHMTLVAANRAKMTIISFGRFQILLRRRELLADGRR
jgi:hypothetical protein